MNGCNEDKSKQNDTNPFLRDGTTGPALRHDGPSNDESMLDSSRYIKHIRRDWEYDQRRILKYQRTFRSIGNVLLGDGRIIPALIRISGYIFGAIGGVALLGVIGIPVEILACLPLLPPFIMIFITLFLRYWRLPKSMKTEYGRKLLKYSYMEDWLTTTDMVKTFQNISNTNWAGSFACIYDMIDELSALCRTDDWNEYCLRSGDKDVEWTETEAMRICGNLAVISEIMSSLPEDAPDDETQRELYRRLKPICEQVEHDAHDTLRRARKDEERSRLAFEKEHKRERERNRMTASESVKSIIAQLDSSSSSETVDDVLTNRRRIDDILANDITVADDCRRSVTTGAKYQQSV